MNHMVDDFDPTTGEIIEPPAAPPQTPPRKRASRKKRGNGRAPIPENETPRDRYLRSSETRMKGALLAIDLVGAFGRNRGNYEYSDQEAERLVARLEAAIADTKRDLARPASREDERKARREFHRD
jgi:hypothetical protein